MVFRYEYSGGVWVDLEQPTEDEIRDVAREFAIGKQFEKELLFPTPSPLVASDGESKLLVLHFPTHKDEQYETNNQEVDFVVGKRFIITIRYEVVAPLYHLKKLLDTQKLLDEKEMLATDTFLEVLFAHLYASVRDHVDHIFHELGRVERDMFDNRERLTIRAISDINRAFLHVEATLANQEESLSRFLKALAESSAFGAPFEERAARILAERAQVVRLVGTYRAIAGELRETNNALLSARQNEIIKILTVVSFIFLPLALIAKIFAIHAADTPFVDDPNAFWVILGLMFVIAVLLTLFVAKKRWI